MPHEECRRGAHLPSLGREPVCGKSLKSVTHGQCDARPAVTFPAAGHHRPLNGTKLCCSVTEVGSRTHDLRSHKSKFIFFRTKNMERPKSHQQNMSPCNAFDFSKTVTGDI